MCSSSSGATFRHPLRTALTILGLAVAILAFGLLRTVVDAWYSGVVAASPVRLVTRNAISLFSPLPLAYLSKIRSLPQVTGFCYRQWFEGVYVDSKHFFPQFAVSMPSFLEIFPEYLVSPEQRLALLQDRRGYLVGRKLAKRFGWRLGDAIILRGTNFPGEYRFIIRAIYIGRDPSTDESQLFFHWDYLNESMRKLSPERVNQVGWFFIRVTDPETAAPVAQQIDAIFKNSTAETLTETEKAFQMGFIAMTQAVLLAIQAVSWVVIAVILVVLANTMVMNTRERLKEYAVLKTMGFKPFQLTVLVLGESLILSAAGGLLGLTLIHPIAKLFPDSVIQYFGFFLVTPLTLILGFGVALSVGIFAALVPAWMAMRVGISEALRKVG